MNNALTISVQGFETLDKKLASLGKELSDNIDAVLHANAEDIATKAKQLAPVDMGGLRAAISVNGSKYLEKSISVNAVHAAYLEFGTGAFASQYVSTLPQSWAAFAAQFRGKTGQHGFLEKIQEWVRRKGIATGKDYKQVAYRIYRSILIHGIHPSPFLYPAFVQQQQQIISDIQNVVKQLGK